MNIGGSLSFERISRYLPAANGDFQTAFRLYLYNMKLCQEFYPVMSMTEIVFRNGIARALVNKYGENWHSNRGVLYRNLNSTGKNLIDEAVNKELSAHGVVTAHRVITGLSLGFWVRLLSPRGPNNLRLVDIKHAFPNLPQGFVKRDLYNRAKSFRDFRNKIFHHHAVFDRAPVREYQNMRTLVEWACEDSLWLMSTLANPIEVVSRKPRPFSANNP